MTRPKLLRLTLVLTIAWVGLQINSAKGAERLPQPLVPHDWSVAPAQAALPLEMLPPISDEIEYYSDNWTGADESMLSFGRRAINYQQSRTMQQSPAWSGWTVATDEAQYGIEAAARAYYFNDHRIEWSGQEATFGAEGVVAGVIARQAGNWTMSLEGELFLNQPYDRNILVDTAERRSFAHNFEIAPLQISQMLLTARNGDLMIAAGRMVTPFGRTYFPLYRTDFSDGPFIRTESILWRETGVVAQYDPEFWVFTAGITNGGLDKDTNSSKALVSRVGVETDFFAAGTSVKWQDGIGSEHQKSYNKHFGVDAMLRLGNWQISGEAIYDYYGTRKPGLNLNDITWGRSIYNRDLNDGHLNPITGVGYYVNAGYTNSSITLMLNYGEFYPEQIGDPIQDTITRRGILKGIYHHTSYLDYFAMLMVENDVPVAQDNHFRGGFNLLVGVQYAL